MALKLCPNCDIYSQICDFCKFYQEGQLNHDNCGGCKYDDFRRTDDMDIRFDKLKFGYQIRKR